MNVETLFAELSARARQLARRARDDAERSAELDRLNPDATLRLVRRSPAAKPDKT